MREITVLDVIARECGADFTATLAEYVRLCPEGARLAAGAAEDEELRLVSARVTRTECSLGNPPAHFPVDVLIEGTFAGKTRRKGQFRMRYVLDLRPGRQTVRKPIVTAEKEVPETWLPAMQGVPGDSRLLPVLRTGDYPAVARALLAAHYPEALERPTRVDGRLLAQRMGLAVREARFPAENDALGLLTFGAATVPLPDETGEVREKTVPPGTILVNTRLCRNVFVRNSTVVHECAHAYLNYAFFLLQGMQNGVSVCAARRRRCTFPVRTPTDWMELQAEKLPGYLLMEEDQLRRTAYRKLKDMGGDRSPGNIRNLTRYLARRFGVTTAMARCRLIGIGYPEAAGMFCWVDGKRVPDYGCGAWEPGQSFVIGLREAALLLGKSAAFRRELESGAYVYTEGHLCLDDPLFVTREKDRPPALTPYARSHVDECCMAFILIGRSGREAVRPAGVALRKMPVTNRYLPRHVFVAEAGSKARARENKAFTEDAQLWADLLRTLPDSFGPAVKAILDAKGLTQEELALRLGIDRRNLHRWWGQERASVPHVVGICVALGLRADVALALLQLSGNALRNNPEDNLYRMMLYSAETLDVERCNEILQQAELAPLTRGTFY